MGLESKYQAECVRTFLWKRYMFIDPVKGDGNCLFNVVIQELEFDTPEDEHFYTSDRLRRRRLLLSLLGGRRNMLVLVGLEHRLGTYMAGQTDIVNVSLGLFRSRLT